MFRSPKKGPWRVLFEERKACERRRARAIQILNGLVRDNAERRRLLEQTLKMKQLELRMAELNLAMCYEEDKLKESRRAI